MKFIHLSDLHLGKRVNEVSMLDEQEYILDEIIEIIDREKPDAVLISGDVYDKSVPTAEAVTLLDGFLCRLAARNLQVMIISGNHDSPERLSFGSRLMDKSGIHIAPAYCGSTSPSVLSDEHGEVYFHMLPFVKPVHVRRYFPDENIESYTDACRTAIGQMNIDPTKRNVLLAHQFVTGAATCESEELSVGGSDNVDSAVFENFDYVALGHIHGPQNVGKENIRYCGTPLKYSFSEVSHRKSVTVVSLEEKGKLAVSTVPLVPKHDMREIRGFYDEITAKSFYENTATDDYLHIILTDEEDVPEAMGRLRVIYPNLIKLTYDNTRTRSEAVVEGPERVGGKSPTELFCEFYMLQNNRQMSDVQLQYVTGLMESVLEDK